MAGRARIFALVGVAAFLAWLNLYHPAPNELVKESARSETLVATNQAGTPQRQLSITQFVHSPPAIATLGRPVLEPTERDPFGLVVPKPAVPVVQAPIALPITVAAAPVAVAPSPPPVNMSFTGRMTAPDGTQIVYVAFGEVSLAITTGQDLPNGYRVESINARSVELRYPPLNTTARLDLPEPPKYETR
jgi:hypothetical protein